MADEASRRRELRRRRILENAEERKLKIFGTSNINVDATKETVKPAAPDLQDSTQIPSSNPTLNCEGESVNNVPHIEDTRTLPTLNTIELQNSPRFDKGENDEEVESRPAPNFFRAENGVESVPEISEHLRNINHLLTASASSGFTASPPGKINNDVQSSSSVVGGLSTPIVPVILALFVCVLLSVNLGYVVSNSIAFPFLLWEAHHLWCCRHVIEAMSRGVGGLLGLALVLCGLQQSLMSKLTQIIAVIKCVFEDFAFYILTIVIWYCFIGLPGSVPSVNEYSEPVPSMNEYSEPETVRVTATNTNEEDMFDHLEF